MQCPNCDGSAMNVMYAGLPMRLCADEACGCLWGFWSWLLAWEILPFNGAFVRYPRGRYWRALWSLLRGECLRDGDEGCP